MTPIPGVGSRYSQFPCYTLTVRNITLAIPETLYRQVRIKAAEMDRSVSALVREYLTQLVQQDVEFENRKRLQREILSQIERFRAGDRIPRDRIHER